MTCTPSSADPPVISFASCVIGSSGATTDASWILIFSLANYGVLLLHLGFLGGIGKDYYRFLQWSVAHWIRNPEKWKNWFGTARCATFASCFWKSLISEDSACSIWCRTWRANSSTASWSTTSSHPTFDLKAISKSPATRPSSSCRQWSAIARAMELCGNSVWPPSRLYSLAGSDLDY